MAVGSATPRLSTAPLRPLSPERSRGFAFAEWCERIGHPLLPWQRECAIAAMEQDEAGDYRHKTVLILVGRQSGKTTLLSLWALWRVLEDDAHLVLGMAQSLDIAREAWLKSAEVAADDIPGSVEKVINANGKECIYFRGRARYRVAAANRNAARGLSVDFLIVDEIREHRDWGAWAAVSKTVFARDNAQIVCISNAGDDQSVVLNTLRSAALAGGPDAPGLFEWSAPDGCDIRDPEMWALGLPALGHTIGEGAVRSALATDPPAVFRTEVLCQHVTSMDTVLDTLGWARGADAKGSVSGARERLYAAVDVSKAGAVVLVVAAAVSGGARVEPVASWATVREARAGLPPLLRELRPKAVGWFPGGPANALAPLLQELRGAKAIAGGDVAKACMTFTDLVGHGCILHNEDPLLDSQVATAERAPMGDGFRFSRNGVDAHAVYAAAGAVWLAVGDAHKKRPAPYSP